MDTLNINIINDIYKQIMLMNEQVKSIAINKDIDTHVQLYNTKQNFGENGLSLDIIKSSNLENSKNDVSTNNNNTSKAKADEAETSGVDAGYLSLLVASNEILKQASELYKNTSILAMNFENVSGLKDNNENTGTEKSINNQQVYSQSWAEPSQNNSVENNNSVINIIDGLSKSISTKSTLDAMNYSNSINNHLASLTESPSSLTNINNNNISNSPMLSSTNNQLETANNDFHNNKSDNNIINTENNSQLSSVMKNYSDIISNSKNIDVNHDTILHNNIPAQTNLENILPVTNNGDSTHNNNFNNDTSDINYHIYSADNSHISSNSTAVNSISSSTLEQAILGNTHSQQSDKSIITIPHFSTNNTTDLQYNNETNSDMTSVQKASNTSESQVVNKFVDETKSPVLNFNVTINKDVDEQALYNEISLILKENLQNTREGIST